ncbi:uncharacterized protein L201_007636 [Kwoniella dendrophila CBS 6074]|uniref:Uncharacterized protein n=1 Tax=Kwoniella dendrophila CBS 6074 TaxID=1295534 RepID=A0AAX4K538_9TREE
MPIILASLVLAFALAALPSTEPCSPDESEQAQHIAYLKDQREKKRRRSRDQSLHCGSDLSDQDRKGKNKQTVLDNQNDENIDGLGFQIDSNTCMTSDTTFTTFSKNHSTQSPIYRSSAEIHFPLEEEYHSREHNQPKYLHLRRSSSLPSFSSTSSNTNSRNSSPTISPGNSPRPLCTPVI